MMISTNRYQLFRFVFIAMIHLHRISAVTAFSLFTMRPRSFLRSPLVVSSSCHQEILLFGKKSNIIKLLPTQRLSPILLAGTTEIEPSDTSDSQRDDDENDDDQSKSILEANFRKLLDDVVRVNNTEHIPSLLSKNMDTILSLSSKSGVQVIESILSKSIIKDGEEAAEELSQVIDFVISFAEEFVQQATQMEERNKKLLGKIILTLSDRETSAYRKEELLDELLQKERDQFTPGFLRHVESQCTRIANAPNRTNDSIRLLEMLSMIQARVLEEVVSQMEWGEAAQVLGQLIGYDNKSERTAVLEAGLTVRGIEFADELLELTNEALYGFQVVPGGADPQLVTIVEDIDKRIKQYKADYDNDR